MIEDGNLKTKVKEEENGLSGDKLIYYNEEKKKEDEENNNSNINWKHNDQELASIRRENYEHNNFVNTSNWVLYKTWENWIVYKPTSVDLKLQENRKYKQNLS